MIWGEWGPKVRGETLNAKQHTWRIYTAGKAQPQIHLSYSPTTPHHTTPPCDWYVPCAAPPLLYYSILFIYLFIYLFSCFAFPPLFIYLYLFICQPDLTLRTWERDKENRLVRIVSSTTITLTHDIQKDSFFLFIHTQTKPNQTKPNVIACLSQIQMHTQQAPQFISTLLKITIIIIIIKMKSSTDSTIKYELDMYFKEERIKEQNGMEPRVIWQC